MAPSSNHLHAHHSISYSLYKPTSTTNSFLLQIEKNNFLFSFEAPFLLLKPQADFTYIYTYIQTLAFLIYPLKKATFFFFSGYKIFNIIQKSSKARSKAIFHSFSLIIFIYIFVASFVSVNFHLTQSSSSSSL